MKASPPQEVCTLKYPPCPSWPGLAMWILGRVVLLAFALALSVALITAMRGAAFPAEISVGVVRIGLILDLSGPYSANTGTGSAAAA